MITRSALLFSLAFMIATPHRVSAGPLFDKLVLACARLLGDDDGLPTLRKAALSTVIPGYLGLPEVGSREMKKYFVKPQIAAKQRMNLELALLPVGPGNDPNLRAQIKLGRVFEEIFVATHQKIDKQKATAARLAKDKTLSGIPRIMLVSEAFPAVRADYAAAASIFNYSFWGEFDGVPATKKVYLAGGFSTLCLANSILGLVTGAQSKKLKEMTVHLLLNEIYATVPMNPRRDLNAGDASFDTFVMGFFTTTDPKLTITNRKSPAPDIWTAELTLRDQFKIHVVLDNRTFRP